MNKKRLLLLLVLLAVVAYIYLRPEVVFQPVCPKSADFRDAVQS
jgi:hypothetical protein